MDFRGDQDLFNNELQNFIVHNGDSFPTAHEGQLFFSTDDSHLYVGTSSGGSIYWYNLTQPVADNFPSGTIAYCGLTTIPTGYVFCDGTNGTVNAQGYFIRGDTTVGIGGAANNHTHSADHNHSFTVSTDTNSNCVGTNGGGDAVHASCSHNHTISTSATFATGLYTNAVSIYPPYITQKLIMKV